MARSARFPRAFALTLAGASLVTGLATVSPNGAVAKSPSAKTVKAKILSARQQLRRLNDQAEQASERYNAARIALSSAQVTATSAQSKLDAAESHVTKLQSSITKFTVAAYQGNTPSILTLLNGQPAQTIARISAMQAVSASESQTIAGVTAARRVEEQAQADANAALAVQRKATTALQADRNQLESAAAQEQTLLGHLEARERAIVRAAKRRAARLAAERRAAQLRQQRLAAARAAREVASQPVQQAPPSPQPVSHVAASGGASTAVAWAYREIGKPYVWGAAGPNSFDCSGLAQYVWGKAGVYLAHFTGDQWNEGTHISRDQLEPGDLVFFAYNTSEPSTIHHVGIYVGGGEMIDAPYTGVDVRKEPAFRSDYIGAVRPG